MSTSTITTSTESVYDAIRAAKPQFTTPGQFLATERGQHYTNAVLDVTDGTTTLRAIEDGWRTFELVKPGVNHTTGVQVYEPEAGGYGLKIRRESAKINWSAIGSCDGIEAQAYALVIQCAAEYAELLDAEATEWFVVAEELRAADEERRDQQRADELVTAKNVAMLIAAQVRVGERVRVGRMILDPQPLVGELFGVDQDAGTVTILSGGKKLQGLSCSRITSFEAKPANTSKRFRKIAIAPKGA